MLEGGSMEERIIETWSLDLNKLRNYLIFLLSENAIIFWQFSV